MISNDNTVNILESIKRQQPGAGYSGPEIVAAIMQAGYRECESQMLLHEYLQNKFIRFDGQAGRYSLDIKADILLRNKQWEQTKLEQIEAVYSMPISSIAPPRKRFRSPVSTVVDAFGAIITAVAILLVLYLRYS